MGIYTDSHGNTYSINIGDPELQMISNNPDFHFCWMNDNDSIRDTKSNYYASNCVLLRFKFNICFQIRSAD